ncbi:LuxR C-terminal-related transcriptional regulator [Desulfobacula sp.]|uniref:LuxR C-terminal-related transcriptional regulator n=1 Tax=Desulfobacula sp. TaxID=2593537 RepID=UPI0039B9007E
MDTDYTIRYVNKNGAAVYGKNHKDLMGEKCYAKFHNTEGPCVICPIEPVLATHRTRISQKWVTLADGRRKCGEIRSYPVFDKKNNLAAVTSIIVDITDTKDRQNKELTQHSEIKFAFSKREIQVLTLISKGYTNPDISQDLGISINTVKSHIVNIFNKLGVNDRTQASIIALKSNLI